MNRMGGTKMKSAIAILGGLGLGAALMYIFDPDRGDRRRALIRDKAVSLNKKTLETINGRVNDLSNRAAGLLHEAKSVFSAEPAPSHAWHIFRRS